MKHYCIFEISHPNKHSEVAKTRFVDEYGEDYTAADEMCQSMNNFRRPEDEVRFCVRCLEQDEFDDVKNYDPILKTIVITTNNSDMDARTDKKWAEILDYARQHATGEGPHKGYKWLQDAYEEYFNDHEERVERGTMPSFGGVSFSDHNRTVFAAQIARALRYNEHGYEGPRLTDEQFEKLTDTLQYIKEHPQNQGIKL